jgi:hypothetical protein
MADDDFEKADMEAGVSPRETSAVEVMAPEKKNTALTGRTSDIMVYRQQLVEQYHAGAPTLVKRLKEAGRDDMDSLLIALIDEVVRETDHLLGNELVATQNGELRDASVISYKRAEVLEKAIKAVQNKRDAERIRGLDVDSPSMMSVFRFFMCKAKDCFERMNVGNEVSDLFFRTLSEATENWKKELREYLEETTPGNPR